MERILTTEDALKDVVRKMMLQPTDWYAENVLELRYDFPHHIVHFHFREPDGRQMSLASASFARQNRHYQSAPDTRRSIRAE
jgi:hypothetical protein